MIRQPRSSHWTAALVCAVAVHVVAVAEDAVLVLLRVHVLSFRVPVGRAPVQEVRPRSPGSLLAYRLERCDIGAFSTAATGVILHERERHIFTERSRH